MARRQLRKCGIMLEDQNKWRTVIENAQKNLTKPISLSIGYLFSATRDIEKILEKHRSVFNKQQKTDEKGKKVGHVWWFTDPSSSPHIEVVPLSERVQTVVLDVLNKDYQVTFDDILQKVFIEFPNSLTPETVSVYNTLKEFAEQVAGGKWRLKPFVKTLLAKHNVLVEELCQLGEWAGYEVFGDIPRRRRSLDFDIPEDQLRRIREIDVLWYKKNEIKYEFEIENTTNIIEALVRGANIEKPVKRIMVVPEEREHKIAGMLKEHRISEMVIKDNWKFLWYNDLDVN
jgi:hypothetical protein